MGDLSANFSKREFACKCGCGEAEMSGDHMVLLQATRNIYGGSMIVSSGRRCKKHNKAVGGANNSEHTAGEASDHPFKNTLDLHNLITAAHKAGFKRVGIDFARKFVHLGSSMSHFTPRLWGYATK